MTTSSEETVRRPVKRYRLSYRWGVVADDGMAKQLSDASQPMVLATAYDAVVAERDESRRSRWRLENDYSALLEWSNIHAEDRDLFRLKLKRLETAVKDAVEELEHDISNGPLVLPALRLALSGEK